MASRVSPTERIRAEIDELFSGDVELADVLEEVARLSMRLTFQSVVEEIVCDEFRRERYQRRDEDSSEGYRKGYQPHGTIKTTLGPVELQRPSCEGPNRRCVTSSSAPAWPAATLWRRWSSPAAWGACPIATSRPRGARTFGDDARIPRSTASRICKRLRAEFDAWKRRDLSGVHA